MRKLNLQISSESIQETLGKVTSGMLAPEIRRENYYDLTHKKYYFQNCKD